MNRKFLMIILIIFLIIGGGSYCLYNWNSDIGMIVDATGTIKPVNSVKLSATASGILEHVYVKQNETVTKGQILATIESKSLTSTMEQAKNTLENKRSYYNRLNSLYEQGAVAYQTMDDARLSYLNAQAAYTKAQADVNDTVITSPLDGVIIGEPMQEGETVSQGLSSQMVIVTVADLSAMKIELLVDDRQYPSRWPPIQEGSFMEQSVIFPKKNILPLPLHPVLQLYITPSMYQLMRMNYPVSIRQ